MPPRQSNRRPRITPLLLLLLLLQPLAGVLPPRRSSSYFPIRAAHAARIGLRITHAARAAEADAAAARTRNLAVLGLLPCVNDCSAGLANRSAVPPVLRGYCRNGTCVCAAGFGGIDCSQGAPEAAGDSGAPTRATDREAATCTQDICTSTCSFGGVCTDTTTCHCNDRWGHGPPASLDAVVDDGLDLDDIDDGDTQSGLRRKKTKLPPRLFIDRRPMTASDRANLDVVLRSLGFHSPIPTGRNDPCLTPWPGAAKVSPPAADPQHRGGLVNPRVVVLCDIDGHVTEIDFSRMKLTGILHPAITRLATLRVVALHNNKLHGTIPDRIGDLSQLEMLLLYKNRLTGGIPPSVVDCSLVTLVLYGNYLTGPLPKDLGHLQGKLQMLDVSFNRLSGEIPGSVGKLINLQELYINNNAFEGALPGTLTQLASIKSFTFQENHFQNTVRNIGNIDVWADPLHDALAEDHYLKWQEGLSWPPRDIKMRAEEEKKRSELQAAKSAGTASTKSALDQKAKAMLPPAFQTKAMGGAGQPGGDLPKQVSGTTTFDGT